MDETTRRRVLAALIAVTFALLVADLAGAGVATAVHRAGGAVFGPVQRALSGAPRDELARMSAENTRLSAQVTEQERELAGLAEVRALLGSQATMGRRMLVGRVVAAELSPLGGRGVTLDIGSRDGVLIDATVVSTAGLVGRVVGVSPWTSDVQVLGSHQSVVGVRVGSRGTLGTVGPATSADPVARARGALTLSLVQPGTPREGEAVTTLGSVDERPYAGGILVGTVTSVDPDRGALTRTAAVQPAVDPDAIDVVAVLIPNPRTIPRPSSSRTGAAR